MIKVAKLKNKELIKEIVFEYERRGNFVRIFPAPGCNEYEKYFQHQKTINRYLHKVLFGGDLISKGEIDLKSNVKLNYDVPKLSSYQQIKEEAKFKPKSGNGVSDASTADDSRLPKISTKPNENSKVVITGDDVLIEYVARIIKKITDGINIAEKEDQCITNFITHYVWHNEDVTTSSLPERLSNRLNEMILRRKKLLKSLCKKEILSGKEGSNTINSMIEERENQKASLLQNFTIVYLEEMLKSTTKSIARDVVSTLIPSDYPGVLLQIDKMAKAANERNEEDKESDSSLKEAKEVSSEIHKVIVHSKPATNFNQNDPYKLTGIATNNKSSSSSVRFPPTNSNKNNSRQGSASSNKASIKNRSNSSKPNSKGL
jgi:hypothetical protein